MKKRLKSTILILAVFVILPVVIFEPIILIIRLPILLLILFILTSICTIITRLIAINNLRECYWIIKDNLKYLEFEKQQRYRSCFISNYDRRMSNICYHQEVISRLTKELQSQFDFFTSFEFFKEYIPKWIYTIYINDIMENFKSVMKD